MSSFRASPWVQYEPASSSSYNRHQDMNDDVDMDAPQISTLREEDTPPPQIRKKITLTIRKPTTAPPEQTSKKREVEEMEPDDEEDQLIDELIDDDDTAAHATPPSQVGRSTEDAQKRVKGTTKKKPRKSDKKAGDGEQKVKEKVSQVTGAHILAPTMSIFKATPAESHEDIEPSVSSPVNQSGEPSPTKGKKKVSPRKPPTIPRAKTKLTKQKSAIPFAVLEDAGGQSESYAGTAASSPVTAPFDQGSPEPENIAPSSPQSVSGPLPEEPNLENVPIPVYPLPTRPFPVQPPQKIPTGTAPPLPLDRGKKRVRHWREANREIRGIAGGRWLARTWVGDKESEFATYAVANNTQTKSIDDKISSTLVLPKLSSVSISAPASIKALGKLKASSKTGSAVTSANPSRATSPSAEAPPAIRPSVQITSTVKAPTKMRILQLAPSSEGDSDRDPPATLDS